MTPCVFLDRDGTLIEERGYLQQLEGLSLFPWSGDAIRLLKRAGFATIVVTNQSAVARGLIDEAFLRQVHREIDARLGAAALDGYYYCPHFPEAPLERYRVDCRCRKPGPGLIEQACRERNIDLARSYMVGDRWLDVECGRSAGVKTLLVRSGHGAEEEANPPAGVQADGILDNLMEAVGWILRHSSPGSAGLMRQRG
jgi:D-glycero-D-manno-heptose 1,7-bisphosphate phosphatase